MIQLLDFQNDLKLQVYAEWQRGNKVVMGVLPTGGGKTVVMGKIAHEYDGAGCAVAHRSELVGQIAIALAREGVRHDIVAPKGVIKTIVGEQVKEVGRTFYDPRAKWKVASVDTIIRRQLDDNWLRQVGLVMEDEGHHALADNKWGKCFAMFPNAYGFLPTASPTRADGKGLGRHHDGIVDAMVVGPDMRWLINNCYLADYQVYCPDPADFDMDGIDISPVTGDYNNDQMRKRVKSSNKIVGDVVKSYLTRAYGLRGITFAVDVEHATTIAAAYNAAGVPAQVVHANTPEDERRKYMRQLKSGELLQLVNVDLFGEGVDVPAVQVVSMARPTASWGLFAQQFGRALRLMLSPILRAAWHTYTVEQRRQFILESGKPHAIIIDHVGNLLTHMGPPDWRKEPWTLDRRNKTRTLKDGIPLRVCLNVVCEQPYERIYPRCPFCGTEPPPPPLPSRPEHVDGDVMLFTTEMMEKLFGERNKIDGPCYVPQGVEYKVAKAIQNNHAARQESQQALRSTMALVMPPVIDPRQNDRTFFHTYGVDTLTAQTLGSADAAALRQKIIDRVTSK